MLAAFLISSTTTFPLASDLCERICWLGKVMLLSKLSLFEKLVGAFSKTGQACS